MLVIRGIRFGGVELHFKAPNHLVFCMRSVAVLSCDWIPGFPSRLVPSLSADTSAPDLHHRPTPAVDSR
uniref:Uncharacterized protein n=1 Tax=Peronospora matthiolae TaxID=2874970 RepID=A0AAV1T0A2_9STRA